MFFQSHVKKIGLIIGLLVVFGALLFFINSKKIKITATRIGILTIASHPALDSAKDAFISVVKEKLPDVDFVIRNADGQIAQAHMIAQSFHNDQSIDLFYAIGTPSLQPLAQVEKIRPIVFAAVTDVQQLGLESQKNICGVLDWASPKRLILDIKQLLPEIQTIGILYNTAEINSVKSVYAMKEELEKQAIQVVEIGVTQESEVVPAVMGKVRLIDAFMTPTDTMVALTMPAIAKIARENKKPLFVTDVYLIHGALLARGIDYSKCGFEAGKMAIEIVNHRKKSAEIGVVQLENGKLWINGVVSRELGITFTPEQLPKDVRFFEYNY